MDAPRVAKAPNLAAMPIGASPPGGKAEAWRADFLSLGALFLPLADAAEELAQGSAWPPLKQYNFWAQKRGLTVRFVAAEPRPGRRARAAARKKGRGEEGVQPASLALSYEERVATRNEVSTRLASWHDFFNLLVWGCYPRLKHALNQRQMAAREPGVVRTREQDRLAIFDEGGTVTVDISASQFGASQKLHFVVGHALFESVLIGRLDIRSYAYKLTRTKSFLSLSLAEMRADIDCEMAALVAAGAFKPAVNDRTSSIDLRHLL